KNLSSNTIPRASRRILSSLGKHSPRGPLFGTYGTYTSRSVRPAELNSAFIQAESGQNVRLAHRPQAYVPCNSPKSSDTVAASLCEALGRRLQQARPKRARLALLPAQFRIEIDFIRPDIEPD